MPRLQTDYSVPGASALMRPSVDDTPPQVGGAQLAMMLTPGAGSSGDEPWTEAEKMYGMRFGNPQAGPGRPPGTGFKELEATRAKTEQEQIRKNLPSPKTQHEKLLDEIKGQSSSEILDNDRLWSMARDEHSAQEARMGFKVPFTKVFSGLAEKYIGRPLTPDEITKVAVGAAKYGIGQ